MSGKARMRANNEIMETQSRMGDWFKAYSALHLYTQRKARARRKKAENTLFTEACRPHGWKPVNCQLPFEG